MYLRFAFENKVYQFRVLPFGLSSPSDFYSIGAHGDRLSSPSGDLGDTISTRLVNSPSGPPSSTPTSGPPYKYTGKKSELDLTQDLQFLGIRLRLDIGEESKAWEIVARARHLSSLQVLTYSQVSQLMGSLNWASGLIPLGRLYLRPLQRHFHSLGLTDRFMPPRRSDPLVLANLLRHWQVLRFLTSGIPIRTFQAEFTIFTDAYTQGWGAHMGDSQISGTWTHTDRKLHINCLDLKAVVSALKHWAPGPPGYDRYGQFDSSFVYQQARRDPFPHLVTFDSRASLVRGSEHNSPSKTYSRVSERDSKPPISSESANTDRVESPPRDREPYLRALGDTRSRHVRDCVELPPSLVHVSNSGATSPSDGCSVSGLAGEVNVHISSIPSAQQSHSEAPVHPGGRSNSHSPLVAETVVVSTPTSSLCGSPPVLSLPSRSSVPAGPEICLGRKVVPSARIESLM